MPLTGVDATIVSSAGVSLAKALPGATPGANASCTPAALPAQEATENPRSTGFLLQFGKFRFLNPGDLTGAPLFNLVCPSDRIGPVDVYLVAHHGGADASAPSTFDAIKPRVAILNNGTRKGGAAETFKTLQARPETATYQLHRSENSGAQNFPDDRIANLGDTTAHWLKISATEDGAFAVTNGRTGVTTQYQPR